MPFSKAHLAYRPPAELPPDIAAAVELLNAVLFNMSEAHGIRGVNNKTLLRGRQRGQVRTVTIRGHSYMVGPDVLRFECPRDVEIPAGDPA